MFISIVKIIKINNAVISNNRTKSGVHTNVFHWVVTRVQWEDWRKISELDQCLSTWQISENTNSKGAIISKEVITRWKNINKSNLSLSSVQNIISLAQFTLRNEYFKQHIDRCLLWPYALNVVLPTSNVHLPKWV